MDVVQVGDDLEGPGVLRAGYGVGHGATHQPALGHACGEGVVAGDQGHVEAVLHLDLLARLHGADFLVHGVGVRHEDGFATPVADLKAHVGVAVGLVELHHHARGDA